MWARGRVFAYLEGMGVHFAPEVEKKLNDLATQSGRGADEILHDALAGYFEEVAPTREILNSRYDDLESGRVKPIPGDEVEAYFREKARQRVGHGNDLPITMPRSNREIGLVTRAAERALRRSSRTYMAFGDCIQEVVDTPEGR